MDKTTMARRALAMVGTHTLEDMLYEINQGKMQSMVHGDTWVVFYPVSYPRKVIVQIFLVVGCGQELDTLWQRVVQWCREHDIDEIWGWGRPGWKKYLSLLKLEQTTLSLFRRVLI